MLVRKDTRFLFRFRQESSVFCAVFPTEQARISRKFRQYAVWKTFHLGIAAIFFGAFALCWTILPMQSDEKYELFVNSADVSCDL